MTAIVPRPAATLILVRDSTEGVQTLMVQRSARADFVAGAYVFPGGGVDADDVALAALLPSSGNDGAADGLDAHRLGAIRECFEEAGILLAAGELAADQLFAEACRQGTLMPAVRALVHLARWITPVGAPKRFDTHFFLAPAPADQRARHDEGETVGTCWTTPEEALARHRRGEIDMVLPTVRNLESLCGHASVEALITWARGLGPVQAIQPRLAKGKGGVRAVPPWDPAYAEVGFLDPEGHMTATDEIVPGVAVTLAPDLVRIAGPEGGNSYLLGGEGAKLVIDPGPGDETHLTVLMAATPGGIAGILLTSADEEARRGADRLRQRSGAALWGPRGGAGAACAGTPVFDHFVSQGDQINLRGIALEVIDAGDGVAYLSSAAGLLFCGDNCRHQPSPGPLQAPGRGFLCPSSGALTADAGQQNSDPKAESAAALFPGNTNR